MITRYVLVDTANQEQDYEYSSIEGAVQQARLQGCAVIEREYELTDTSLVWTPNSSDTWPPA